MRKREKIIFVAMIAVALIASAAVWAATDTAQDWVYLPRKYGEDQSVSLGLMAKGSNVALDYFPGGYAVYPKLNGGKRAVPAFYIHDPQVQADEAWPYVGQGMKYRFRWTDSSGISYHSEFKAKDISGAKTGWVDVMDIIKANAYDENAKRYISASPDNLKAGTTLVVKVFFEDDLGSNGVSSYENVSKKFAFRVDSAYVTRMGIAASVDDAGNTLFTAGGGLEIPAEKLYQANFATVHVQPNIPNKSVAYEAFLPAGKQGLKIITVDTDNARVDPANAVPQIFNSYVDFSAIRADKTYIGLAGETVADGSVFWRIAPYVDEAQASAGISDSHGSIPALPAWAGHSYGPSGSFQCGLPIGDPNWADQCYLHPANAVVGPDGKWVGIMQHYVPLPVPSEGKAVMVQMRNSSTYAGNAFAIASDTDLWAADPDVPTVEPAKPDPLDPAGTGSVAATTYVEVTMPAATPERGFDDNGKDTASGATHTYKTEVCNGTPTAVQGVKVRLNLPEYSSLVGDPGDLTGSSLMINGSRLDESPDASKVLDASLFGTDLTLGELVPGQCGYFTYQAEVEPGSATGAALKVKNQFTSGSGAVWSDTNEVVNQLAQSISGSLTLEAQPPTGSKVQRGDYVEYTVTFHNGGTATIPAGTITCGRMADDALSECLVGQCSRADFAALEPGADYQFTHSVRVKPEAAKDAVMENSCRAEFSGESADSNRTSHVVDVPSTAVAGGSFELELYSRPKLINSPDGNPRPDGLDASPIQYTYRYSGSHADNFYPKLSNAGGYSYGSVRCGPSSLPYYPNAFTYWGNSASTSPRGDPGVGSSPLTFSLSTALPSAAPKTTLKSGTLTPTHQVGGGELNSWFVNGGEKVLPIESTAHRALVNGRDGVISATIDGTMQMDKWQYVPYATSSCSYVISCGKKRCSYGSRTYSLYRWQNTSRTPVPFAAAATRAVDVTGSTGWLRTRNGDVHTNNRFSQDGTSANVYDLGESGYEAVRSSPKSYTPPGSFHSDYFVSTNAASSNLSSKRGWYAIRQLPFGHGDVYDRSANPRDYYGDLLDRQKFGKVVSGGPNPLRSFEPGLNEIWYWPGDLVVESPSGTFKVGGKKATIVVGGNLRIKSNMAYVQPSGSLPMAEMPYLGLVVKGDVTIDPSVTETVGAWHVDGTLHTGAAAKRWKHLGQIAVGDADLQRKAPEFNDGETNAPSEDIVFDDNVYNAIPPGFAQLDDGVWAFFTSVNQYSGKVSNWWDSE